MLIRTIFYQHIKILIKHAFLLNFRHELLLLVMQHISIQKHEKLYMKDRPP